MRSVLYLLLASVFVGCSATSIYTNNNYFGADLSQKKMLVMPLDSNSVFVHNKDDIQDDFPDSTMEPIRLVSELLHKSISKRAYMYTNVLDASPEYLNFRPKLGSDLLNVSTEIDGISFSFLVPQKATLQSMGIDPDFILIVSKAMFGRISQSSTMYMPGHKVSTPGGSFTTPGTTVKSGGPESLNSFIEFIIYDYANNEIITCGRLSVDKKLAFEMTESTWRSCFDDIAFKIFQKVSFKRLKI